MSRCWSCCGQRRNGLRLDLNPRNRPRSCLYGLGRCQVGKPPGEQLAGAVDVRAHERTCAVSVTRLDGLHGCAGAARRSPVAAGRRRGRPTSGSVGSGDAGWRASRAGRRCGRPRGGPRGTHRLPPASCGAVLSPSRARRGSTDSVLEQSLGVAQPVELDLAGQVRCKTGGGAFELGPHEVRVLDLAQRGQPHTCAPVGQELDDATLAQGLQGLADRRPAHLEFARKATRRSHVPGGASPLATSA